MSWQDSYLACSGTHHLIDGEPLYADRYDEVLKFHAPGLAPVRRGGSAWHIRPDGAPAYDRRFRRTFGFYEGMAAVEGEGGWHHIHPDGTEDLGGDQFWDNASLAECGSCGQSASVAAFDADGE